MRLFVLGFLIGVVLLQSQERLPDGPWLVLSLGTVLAGLGRRQFAQGFAISAIFTLLGGAGVGFGWAATLAQVRLADALTPELEGKTVVITGTVGTLPQRTDHGVRFEFDIERNSGETKGIPRHIQLNWYERTQATGHWLAPVHAGERWRLAVRLRQPHGSVNPHGFDFEAWLLERNIRATGYVRMEQAPVRLNPPASAWRYGIERAREHVRDAMRARLAGTKSGPVLIALAIGDQSGVTQAQWDVFWRTGIGHLISISGLHVTMVGSMAFALVLWIWRRVPYVALRVPARKAAVAAALLTCTIYALLAGFSVPTQRTLISLLVVGVALWRDRLRSPSQVLAIALLAVLLWDPWAVTGPGFWLSFGAVALIFWVGANRTGVERSWQSAVRTQWAVTIGLLPLTALWFQQFSLVSPLANAIAIPVMSLVIVPLTLLGLFPGLDFLLLFAAWGFDWVHALMVWLSGWSFASITLPAPPLWALIYAVLGVFWLLLPRGFPARWLGGIWLGPLLLIRPAMPAEGEFWVRVLDVGQGLAVVVQTRTRTLLFDTGPQYSEESDSANRIIMPFLRAQGIAGLDGVIVSHADKDHSGGMSSLVKTLPVTWVAWSTPMELSQLSPTTRTITCLAGQIWHWDEVSFEFLHPTPQWLASSATVSNDRGCVLKVTSHFGNALLPADIEAPVELRLTEASAEKLPADLLVAPHHGSNSSSTPAFLGAVGARHIVVSAGYRNRFRHPSDAVMDRYAVTGAKIWRTDRQGAILAAFGARGISVIGERARAPRYWYGR